MKSALKNIDYLKDPPIKILFKIIMPIMLISLSGSLVGILTNAVYSKYVGDSAFNVVGLISMVTILVTNVANAVISSAWIKTAYFYQNHTQEEKNYRFVQGFYSVLFVNAAIIFFALVFKNPILNFCSIPQGSFEQTSAYYVGYICTTVIVNVCAYIEIISSSTGGIKEIAIINAVPIVSSPLVAFLMLGLFKMGFVGFAMVGAMARFVLLAILIYSLFRRKVFAGLLKKLIVPDFKVILPIFRYAAIISFQSLVCDVGFLLVAKNSNAYLSSDYITAIGISMPTLGVAYFGSAVTYFIPQNYQAGEYGRVKEFFRNAILVSFAFDVVTVLTSVFLSEAYYGLFVTSPEVIALGKEYSVYQAFSYFGFSLIYVFRFGFDAMGMSKVTLLSALGEIIADVLCAFWLIPTFGYFGRNVSQCLRFLLAGSFIMIAYFVLRKKIYPEKTTVETTEKEKALG